jgi:hypothetical protein
MRLLQVLGILFIIAGVAVLWMHPSYKSRKNVVTIGEWKATVAEREGVPLWVGAVAVGGGVALLLAANRRPN